MTDEDEGKAKERADSSDWRFAVLVLLVLLLSILVTSVVLFVRQESLPEGFASLGAGLTGALIVLIGKRTF